LGKWMNVADRRSEPRLPALLWGKVIFKEVARDCLIHDLSVSGARLQLTAFAALPDKFDLFILEKRRTFRAIVQWRAGDQAGVVFEQTANNQDETTAEILARMQALETQVQDLARVVAALRGTKAEGRDVVPVSDPAVLRRNY
jgi:hypothetical protein